MYYAQTFAAAHRIETEDPKLDAYARHGVILSHDAASVVLAALSRDSYELRQRGGAANLEAAAGQDKLHRAILKALAR